MSVNRPRTIDPDSKLGLYRKFHITRDDPDSKHVNCFYFVLDMNHDEFAIDALATYAEKCAEKYPVLAADLHGVIARAKITQAGETDEPRER